MLVSVQKRCVLVLLTVFSEFLAVEESDLIQDGKIAFQEGLIGNKLHFGSE